MGTFKSLFTGMYGHYEEGKARVASELGEELTTEELVELDPQAYDAESVEVLGEEE